MILFHGRTPYCTKTESDHLFNKPLSPGRTALSVFHHICTLLYKQSGKTDQSFFFSPPHACIVIFRPLKIYLWYHKCMKICTDTEITWFMVYTKITNKTSRGNSIYRQTWAQYTRYSYLKSLVQLMYTNLKDSTQISFQFSPRCIHFYVIKLFLQ